MENLDMLGAEDGTDERLLNYERGAGVGSTIGGVLVGTAAALLWRRHHVAGGILGALVGVVVGGVAGGFVGVAQGSSARREF